MKIKYMKMPVSLEEKRALNKEGIRIVDIQFKPVEVEEKPKAKAKKA
jgi:hypothetical protein